MSTRDYLTKVHIHLQDRNTYKPLTYNRTSAIVNDTCTLIELIHSQHIIDKATKGFLLPSKNKRTPLFYGLPKFTSQAALPSHIKETKHFLNIIKKLATLPPNALLVIADVMSLYTENPHEEDIAAVIHFMQKHNHLLPTNWPLSHIVRIILDFILKHSTFKFMDKHIPQILGTSMETRMAPPYVHLFTGKEGTIILTFLHLIYFWKISSFSWVPTPNITP